MVYGNPLREGISTKILLTRSLHCAQSTMVQNKNTFPCSLLGFFFQKERFSNHIFEVIYGVMQAPTLPRQITTRTPLHLKDGDLDTIL